MLVRQLGAWEPNGTGGTERRDAWDVARADVRPAWREDQVLNLAQLRLRADGIERRWATYGDGGYARTMSAGQAAADTVLLLAGVEFPEDVAAEEPNLPVYAAVLPVRPGRILRLVAEAWRTDVPTLRSPKRARPVVQARQIAMFLLRRHTGLTLVAIGDLLGGRDHTTVIYGIRKIARNPQLRAAADVLAARFEED